MSSWHRSYRGRSIGRILHFLYHYCGFDIAEHAQIGESRVIYHGRTIANYEFIGDTDIVEFTFLPDSNDDYFGQLTNKNIARWERNQKEKLIDALKDQGDAEPCRACKEKDRSIKLIKSMTGWKSE